MVCFFFLLRDGASSQSIWILERVEEIGFFFFVVKNHVVSKENLLGFNSKTFFSLSFSLPDLFLIKRKCLSFAFPMKKGFNEKGFLLEFRSEIFQEKEKEGRFCIFRIQSLHKLLLLATTEFLFPLFAFPLRLSCFPLGQSESERASENPEDSVRRVSVCVRTTKLDWPPPFPYAERCGQCESEWVEWSSSHLPLTSSEHMQCDPVAVCVGGYRSIFAGWLAFTLHPDWPVYARVQGQPFEQSGQWTAQWLPEPFRASFDVWFTTRLAHLFALFTTFTVAAMGNEPPLDHWMRRELWTLCLHP